MIISQLKAIKDKYTEKPGKIKTFVLIALAALILATGSFFLIKTVYSYIDGITEANNLKSLYEIGQETAASSTPQTVMETLVPDDSKESNNAPMENNSVVKPEEKTILPVYNELLKVNKEVIGWIKVEGTRIDYPMLQHDDNEYYLHTSIENKKSKRGCIYIDYRNNSELTDKNTLIYAHNMKDGSMFKDLVQYKKKSFFDSHSLINIDNLYEEGVWEVFSVYIVDADKETIEIDYSEEGSFMKAIDSFKDRSMFETDVVISNDDRIVTLVTCSYETRNARTIVHARYMGKYMQ